MNKHNVIFVRLLAFVLAAVMVGGILPVIAVSADGEGGDRTITAVYYDHGSHGANTENSNGGFNTYDQITFWTGGQTTDASFVCLRMSAGNRITAQQSRYLHFECNLVCNGSISLTFALKDSTGNTVKYSVTKTYTSGNISDEIDFGAVCGSDTSEIGRIDITPAPMADFSSISFANATVYSYTKVETEPDSESESESESQQEPDDPTDPLIDPDKCVYNDFLHHEGGLDLSNPDGTFIPNPNNPNQPYHESTVNVGWYYQAINANLQSGTRSETTFKCNYMVASENPLTYHGGVIAYPELYEQTPATQRSTDNVLIDASKFVALTITYTLAATNPVIDASSKQPLGVLVEVLSSVDRVTSADKARNNKTLISEWIPGEAGTHTVTLDFDGMLSQMGGESIEGIMIRPYQAYKEDLNVGFAYIHFDELGMYVLKDGEEHPTESTSEPASEPESEPETEPPVYTFEEVHVYEEAGQGVTLTREELLRPLRKAIPTITDTEAYNLVVNRCGSDGKAAGTNQYTTNNWESDITYKNTSGKSLIDTFYYSVTGYHGGTVLNHVLKVTVYSLKAEDYAVVLDYGLPVTLNTADICPTFPTVPYDLTCTSESMVGTPTSLYGTFTINGDSVKYTPTRFMNGSDSFSKQFTLMEEGAPAVLIPCYNHQCLDNWYTDSMSGGPHITDGSLPNCNITLTGASSCYLLYGWYGNDTEKDIAQFGYQIGSADPVFNSTFTNPFASDADRNAVQLSGNGGSYALRFSISVPVAGLSDGTYPVKIAVKHINGHISYPANLVFQMKVGTGTGASDVPISYTGSDADFKYVGVTLTQTISVVPANVVYYEDTFAGITYKGDGWNTIQVLNYNLGEQSANQSTPYGFDSRYATEQKLPNNEGYASNGSIHKLLLTATSDVLSFEFTGTGFDLISRVTVDKCAILSVTVTRKSDGTVIETIPIMAESPSVDYYQIPLIGCHDLDRDTYTVSVRMAAAYSQRQFYVDGLRIYGSLEAEDAAAYYNSGEANAEFLSVRDLILDDKIAVVSESSGTLVAGSFIYFDADTKIPIEDGNVDNYLKTGPKGELYIDPATGTSAIAFYLKPVAGYEGDRMIQIGAHRKTTNKTDAGWVCMVGAGDLPTFLDDDETGHFQYILTGTEMYYPVMLGEADENGRYLVIIGCPSTYSENFSEFLSLTNLKIAGYEIETFEPELTLTLNQYLSAYIHPEDKIITPSPLINGKPCWEKVIGSEKTEIPADRQWIMRQMNTVVFADMSDMNEGSAGSRYAIRYNNHIIHTMWSVRPQIMVAVNA